MGYQDDLDRQGNESRESEPGIHAIVGGLFSGCLIETDGMAARDQPVLSLFSRAFLKDRLRSIDLFKKQGL